MVLGRTLILGSPPALMSLPADLRSTQNIRTTIPSPMTHDVNPAAAVCQLTSAGFHSGKETGNFDTSVPATMRMTARSPGFQFHDGCGVGAALDEVATALSTFFEVRISMIREPI